MLYWCIMEIRKILEPWGLTFSSHFYYIMKHYTVTLMVNNEDVRNQVPKPKNQAQATFWQVIPKDLNGNTRVLSALTVHLLMLLNEVTEYLITTVKTGTRCDNRAKHSMSCPVISWQHHAQSLIHWTPLYSKSSLVWSTLGLRKTLSRIKAPKNFGLEFYNFRSQFYGWKKMPEKK